MFDPDPGARSSDYRALSVLYACEVEFMQLIERLRASARDGRKLQPQVTSIEALGRLRDADSFDFFVSLPNGFRASWHTVTKPSTMLSANTNPSQGDCSRPARVF